MRILQVVSHSEEQTVALAAKLANAFMPGDLVVLKGELGAGKTVFVRGLAQAKGIDTKLVNSPSYTFVNEYPGETPIYHFDLYRMGETTELVELGWNDYLSRGGITIVEWGERAKEELPKKYYHIEITIINETEREFDISLIGKTDE